METNGIINSRTKSKLIFDGIENMASEKNFEGIKELCGKRLV